MARRKPTLKEAAEELEAVAEQALQWIDCVCNHGTLPMTRRELEAAIRRALRMYARATK